MGQGDAFCLISLPYLVMCGIFYHHLDNITEKIIKESGLYEDDENQLLWMIGAMALPMLLLSPILYLFEIQNHLIYWLVWKKIERRSLLQLKGG